MTTRLCSIEECGRPYLARGLCNAHYIRWRLRGDAGTAAVARRPPAGTTCSVEKCERKYYALDYCRAHYARRQRGGEARTTEIAEPHARSEMVTYHGAHVRVRNARGRAGDHSCRECTEPATDWAYTHDDPDEVTDSKGRCYSLHESRYAPMCRPCHRRFDAAARSRSKTTT